MDVEDVLRIVLVRQMDDGHQGLDIGDERVASGVDSSEEYLECFWRIVNVDDGEFRGLGGWGLWNGEHIPEYWRREG